MKYANLVEVYKKLESTSKRLEKTHYISELLKDTDADDLPIIILLIRGQLFPQWDEQKIGVAARLVLKAINVATGISQDVIEKEWKKTGDLGIVAENLVQKKKQSTLFSKELTAKKVFENSRKLALMEGKGSVDLKVKTIAEMLSSAKPVEARFIVRTILEELRAGVGEGAIRDAIVWAFFEKDVGFKYDQKTNNFEVGDREKYNKYAGAVQAAYDKSNDFGIVTKIAKEKGLAGLEKVGLSTGKPIKVMLYQKAKDIEGAFDSVGKPAAIEYKYDGFRAQVHKADGEIKIFTRSLEDVTEQFQDIARLVKENIKAQEFIIDGEIIGIDPKTKKWLPFQNISQRIKRKYDIEEISKKIPVMLHLFDIIELNRKSVLNEPFKKRREMLDKIVKEVPDKLKLAKQIITSDVKEAQKFYDESLKKGNEGIMMKNLEGIYKPGSRVGYGVKVKPTMESLDLVVVGAEWGEGKRASWLTSFTIACRNEDTNEFLEIGKVGTGFKEKTEEGVSFEEMTELLKPLIKSEKGKSVKIKPKVVIEVTYEEIQKSPTYSSGYALRFPRVLRLRHVERSPEDASTLETVELLYEQQKK